MKTTLPGDKKFGQKFTHNDANAVKAAITELDGNISNINSLNLWIPKNAVATKAALVTTYTTPAKNWAAMALDDGYIYVNDGLGALEANWVNSGQKAFPDKVISNFTTKNGVSSFKWLAGYAVESSTTGSVCLKTPIHNQDAGFIVLKLSIFDLTSNASIQKQQELIISCYISAAKAQTLFINSVGSNIVNKIRGLLDSNGYLNFIFNDFSTIYQYSHYILQEVNTSFAFYNVDMTNGFNFYNITDINGWGGIDKTVLISDKSNLISKRSDLTGVTEYKMLCSAINNNPTSGAFCLKTPFTTTTNNGGFIVLKFSIFDLNSSASISKHQSISISIYISGGFLTAFSANSTGDVVITKINAMLDSNNCWRFIFNDVLSTTPYRHIILDGVETSFGLEIPDLSDSFSFSFIANTTGLGSIRDKSIEISNPITSTTLISDDSFNVLSNLIVGQAKITKYTKTGNAIVIGDSTIDNVYGFDGVAEYLPIIGTITDISTGGDNIANQVTKWNAISSTLKSAANYIFIQIGINNLTNSTNVTSLVSELQSFIDLINSQAPQAKVIVGTITPYFARFVEIYGSDGALIAQQKWVDFNEAIKGNGSNPITGVDARAYEHTTKLSTSTGALKTIYNSGDQLHENNLGRLEIALSWIKSAYNLV